MRIVHRQQERRSHAQLDAQPVQTVHDGVRLGRRVEVGLEHHSGAEPGGAAQELLLLGARQRLQHGCEELAYQAERESLLELAGASAQDAKALVGRPFLHRLEQTSLAGAHRAADDHHAAAVSRRRSETVTDQRQLALSLQ